MFGSDILDVAIGVLLLFLLMSLIASAAQEALEGILKSRAKDLERGIRELLRDPDGSKAEKLFEHPLLFSLFCGSYDKTKLKDHRFSSGSYMRFSGRNLPSYIPAANFAGAVLDLVATGAFPGTAQSARGSGAGVAAAGQPAQPQASVGGLASAVAGAPAAVAAAQAGGPAAGAQPAAPGDAGGAAGAQPAVAARVAGAGAAQAPSAGSKGYSLDQLRSAAEQLPAGSLKQALLSAFDRAQGDAKLAQANLEEWFNGTMDRVSGWYKRRTQWILFFIGLFAAVALNVDTIAVTQELGRNKALREMAVERATQVLTPQTPQEQKDGTAAGPEDAQAEAGDQPTEDVQQAATEEEDAAGPGGNEPEGQAAEPAGDVEGEAAAPAGTEAQSRDASPGLEPAPVGGEPGAGSEPTSTAAAAPTQSTAPSDSGLPQQDQDERNAERDRTAEIRNAVQAAGEGSLEAQLEEIGYPIGWKSWWPAPQRSRLECRDGALCFGALYAPSVLSMALGWLITALAVMLGAPFWFDVLNKFMVIRSTVKPTEKSPEEGSEDRRKR